MRRGRGPFPRAFLVVAALAILGGGLFLLAPTETASAHPLGNFTINQYSRIEIIPGQVSLHYVLDMAEIPAFQEMARIDLDQDGQVSDEEHGTYLMQKVEELRRGLYLSVNGSPVRLEVVDQGLSFPPGQGNLSTLRLDLLLKGPLKQMGHQEEQALYYRDENHSRRLGWKEIVLRAGDGVSLLDSTAPEQDRSNELRTYPQGMLNSPSDLREARSTFRIVGSAKEGQESPSTSIAPGPEEKSKDVLTSLVTTERLSLSVVILSFVLALGLGALHAMSPGHGKTIMAAYLVGTRGTARHALFLGLTVAISHTVGVLALGLVTLYASHVVAPERLYPWLGLASGGIILAVGIWLIVARLRGSSRTYHHHHNHSHHQPEGDGRPGLSWKNLAALGVANGLVPSVSALIILLAAISLHRFGFGLLLILGFSAGMAVTLTGVGLLLVYAGRVVERLRFKNPLANGFSRLLPLATALVVLVSGTVLTMRGVFQVGLL